MQFLLKKQRILTKGCGSGYLYILAVESKLTREILKKNILNERLILLSELNADEMKLNVFTGMEKLKNWKNN